MSIELPDDTPALSFQSLPLLLVFQVLEMIKHYHEFATYYSLSLSLFAKLPTVQCELNIRILVELDEFTEQRVSNRSGNFKKKQRFPINDRIIKLFRVVSASLRVAPRVQPFLFQRARCLVNAKNTTDLYDTYRCSN